MHASWAQRLHRRPKSTNVVCATLRMRNACNYFWRVALSCRCHFQLSPPHTGNALTAFELFLECINERSAFPPFPVSFPPVQPSSTRRAVSTVRIKWNKTKSKLKRCRCQRLLSSLAVRASSRFIFSFLFFFLFWFSVFSFCFCFCNKVEFGTSVGCS